MNKSFRLKAVQRIRSNESQTKKGCFERWISVNEYFAVTEPNFLAGKHVLLVDDVVTIGVILEACASAILLVLEAKLLLQQLHVRIQFNEPLAFLYLRLVRKYQYRPKHP